MKKITLAASLLITPAIAQAQTSVQAQSKTNVSTSASVTPASANGAHRLGVDAQSKVDANLRVARERRLPDAPIRERVAEGQAKGATDAQVVAASGRTLVDLQSSFDAMGRGGHPSPSDAEITRGAALIARGYTSVQIEGVARTAPSDRSLVVAFDVLTTLRARGVATGRAAAQLEGELAARASDAQLLALGVNGDATAGVSSALTGGRSAGSATGSASGRAGASGVAESAAAGAGAAATSALGSAASGASSTAGVKGAVSGVLGKP